MAEYGSEEIITMTMGEYKDNLAKANDRGAMFIIDQVKELYPDIVNTEIYKEWFWVDPYEEES